MHSPAYSLRIAAQVVVIALSWCNVSQGQDQTVDVDRAIAKHRKGVLEIRATPNTGIQVEQLHHEFWFGAALANQAFDGRMPAPDREKYLAVFLTNFNAAVTENALKWHDMERQKGKVKYSTVDSVLAWTDQNKIPLRGHNIFWGVPDQVQDWLKELPDDAFLHALRNRAMDIGRRYKGRFAEYDLNNEMIHGNYYEERLGPNITREMTRWVHEADPDAKLFLNDYNILTGVKLEDYFKHIRTLLDQKVPIAGIGVQGHLHGESFDRAKLHEALRRLSEFNLPIRVTEFNMPGQTSRFYKDRSLRLSETEENAKARELVDYYRICFSYPRVEGILMWGFWEGANWIPVSSLYKRDWPPLPAAKAYQDLIHGEWWTRWSGKTDAQGRCEVPAFYGEHRISAGDKSVQVTLRKSDGRRTIELRMD